MTESTDETATPEGMHPRLWETLSTLDLPPVFMTALAESPEEEVGDILLDAVDHLGERSDTLLEAIRAHPPTVESGQFATVDLIHRLRGKGRNTEADTLVEELAGERHLAPGPAHLLAESFEEAGDRDRALRYYNIAAREALARPAAELHRVGEATLPLVARARLRERMGLPADEHDRLALDVAESGFLAGEETEPWVEDEEEPTEVRGVVTVYSRDGLARARELGLLDADVTEESHYTDVERFLRTTAQEFPDKRLVVAVAEPDALIEFAAQRELDPTDKDTLGIWARETLPGDSPRLVSWPPERNKPCWCGSQRKYKKCCGSPALR